MKLRMRLLVLLGVGVALIAFASVLAAGARKDLGIVATGGMLTAAAATQGTCPHESATCGQTGCGKGVTANKAATCGAAKAAKQGPTGTCGLGSCGCDGAQPAAAAKGAKTSHSRPR